MTSLRLLPIALAALSLAACTGAPAPAITAAASAGPAASSSPLVAYHYSELDLCPATDLSPLAGLKLTVQDKRRKLPLGRTKGEGELCLHEMKTASGHIARLTVEAILAASADEAQRIYRTVEQDSMKADGALAGPWERGAGRTIDTAVGYQHSEYLVHAVNGNLYISVWLAVGGNAYTPKEELAPMVRAIAEKTYATVTRAWK